MTPLIPEDKWAQFFRDGYVILDKVLSDEDIAVLNKRLDEIMLGQARMPYERMRLQREGMTGWKMGFHGAGLDYLRRSVAKSLLQQIARIRHMERGKLCSLPGRPYVPSEGDGFFFRVPPETHFLCDPGDSSDSFSLCGSRCQRRPVAVGNRSYRVSGGALYPSG